ncbi:alginate lyase family protein [Luteimonas sp. SJ-92]|uniref:Alginate lyase family protein n=1 Tax=Luteimonas salinisoli TaxID=2752307 RepID=A0A853JA64_9GAMM|nr:heparinase II/III family protein [Luteimonas salinisoli]NZA25745.1 alginate lyase family protein [Luteimonas salinisoli]
MSAPSRLLRLWRTARHLRPVQVYGRAWHRLYRPRPSSRPAPPVAARHGDWERCPRDASMIGPARFRLLNVERPFPAGGWNDAALPKLWLYNLHYFDDLNADGNERRVDWHRALIARWIADNPPAEGNGWEPYCLSLRIVNWIKWHGTGRALDQAALHSLAMQARQLRARLERHLLGNHLWANFKALIFAGAFFEGDEADRWLALGLQGLHRQLDEQILDDGGHFERSPMYHGILLEDLVDLVQLAQRHPGRIPGGHVEAWRARARRMLGWLAAMTHPDGGIAFFNDAAHGIAAAPAALINYAGRFGIAAPQPPAGPLRVLGGSGYVRMVHGAAVAIADVGEIGPPYLPGHAHADTLSFELSLGAHRVLVNAGTSRYDTGPERLWQRGTAAHNTVEIDDTDSSEVWSSFRVARRAIPLDVASGIDGTGAVWLRAAHDGYRRLPGRPLHRRRWDLRDGALRVTDAIEGGYRRAVARFRLAPELRMEGDTLVVPDGRRVRWLAEGATGVRTVAGSWFPHFGVERPCTVIEVELAPPAAAVVTTFFWSQ